MLFLHLVLLLRITTILLHYFRVLRLFKKHMRENAHPTLGHEEGNKKVNGNYLKKKNNTFICLDVTVQKIKPIFEVNFIQDFITCVSHKEIVNLILSCS